MRIYSWNVNGIRAVHKKGLLDWLEKEKPDILCLQETKASPDQLDDTLRHPPGYYAFFHSAEKKGYSGVATYTRYKPEIFRLGLKIDRFDREGRVLLTEFSDFVLLNIYFPNGKNGTERLQYKLDFYEEVLKFFKELRRQGKKIITCGDFNTAHKAIDLARPEANEKISGFLPEERAWIDRWIQEGNVDIFREFCPLAGQYTWWDMKTAARDRNIGWRIDYLFISNNLLPFVEDAKIHPAVQGSDHCPISIELKPALVADDFLHK